MATTDAVQDHYTDRKALAVNAAAYALQQWNKVDRDDIGRSWLRMLPGVAAVLSAAQLAAAEQADPYLDDVAPGSAVDTLVVAAAFAGAAADGRSLASLLFQPVMMVLRALGLGAPVERAMAGGAANLDMIVRTEVADAGRVADQVGITARPELDGYIRVVVGDSCNRCIILAGRWYRYSEGFERHPRCDCAMLPASQAEAAGLVQDPQAIYESMTERERTQAGWSEGDQKAIDAGADINQVTNATNRVGRKKSVYTAGGREFTRESTTKRGVTRGRLKHRMTPDQIFIEAGDDRDEAIRLLQEHGYLTGEPRTVTATKKDLALAADAAEDFSAGVAIVEDLVLNKGMSLDQVIEFLQTSRASADILAAARRAKDPKRLVTTLRGMRTRRAGAASKPVAVPKVDADDNLERRTVPQLRALAKDRGVKLGSRDRKADIIAKLRAAGGARKPDRSVPANEFGDDYEVRRMTNREAQLASLEAQLATAEADRIKHMAQWAQSLRLEVAKSNPDKRMVEYYKNGLAAANLRPQQLRNDIAQLKASKDPALDRPSIYESNIIRVGTPSQARVTAHLDKTVVSTKLSLKARLSTLKQLNHQASLSTRTAMRLSRVSAPERHDDIDYIHHYPNVNAFYVFDDARMVLSPHRLNNLDGWTAMKLNCFRTGWSTWSGADDGLGSTVAHEYGHHIDNMIFGRSASSSSKPERARPLIAAIGKAFGIKDVDPTAADVQQELKRILSANKAKIQTLVSEYGTESMHEMLAEIWQEYSTMGAKARPHIRAIGDLMRRLADEGALE